MKSTVAEVLAKKGPQTHGVDVDSTVAEAVRKMKDLNLGSVVILRGEHVVGIFTERDIARRVVFGGLDPAKTQVSEVMTAPVAFVDPATTVAQAMKVMSRTHCRHLPVFDHEKLVGLVSLGDLVRQSTADSDAHVRFLESYIRGR
jgi:CBS domain-containing protein